MNIHPLPSFLTFLHSFRKDIMIEMKSIEYLTNIRSLLKDVSISHELVDVKKEDFTLCPPISSGQASYSYTYQCYCACAVFYSYCIQCIICVFISHGYLCVHILIYVMYYSDSNSFQCDDLRYIGWSASGDKQLPFFSLAPCAVSTAVKVFI